MSAMGSVIGCVRVVKYPDFREVLRKLLPGDSFLEMDQRAIVGVYRNA